MITAAFIDEGLHELLESAGFAVHFRDNELLGTRIDGGNYIDAECQVVIDSYDPLPHAKRDKIRELKVEGLSRVQSVFPAIKNFDDLDLVREQYLSVAPAARQPTTDFQTAIDIVGAGRSAVVAINALNDYSSVIAYDVVLSPAWP